LPNCSYCKKPYINYGYYFERHQKNCYERLITLFLRENERLKELKSQLSERLLNVLKIHSKGNLKILRNAISTKIHLEYLKSKYPDFYKYIFLTKI